MKRGFLVAIVIAALSGCGGSSGSAKPGNEELGKMSTAFSQLLTHCIGSGSAGDAQEAADVLVDAAHKYGDTEFKLNPNAPNTTANKLARKAAASTANCDPGVTQRLQEASGG